MITIENLELRLDVEGSDDRATFARLFHEYMKAWTASTESHRERDLLAAQTRELGLGGGSH
jgi:hypothetical protein